ncbi:phosphatase PAP2 family protein [Pelagicoccus sp. SDUM812002]|uniref:phosphatase PAP2 family protein n=1 Tax=Pelagicoccus sp. SDUM812002 TaxID=3041266 RepID=UPI00280E3589|nr:phosphatase PAP2 family protein [Pelagicoccus sp. SDUM812002]MDQ8187622.1 phosphatase PAP2 family protein [Pelagicoccus sp. SDUM812002]
MNCVMAVMSEEEPKQGNVAVRKNRRRNSIRQVFYCLLIALGAWGFLEIADEVAEDDLRRFDESILLSLRESSDLGDPIGPLWMEELARDVTALGSFVILGIFVSSSAIFLFLSGKLRSSAFLISSSLSGVAVSSFLKEFYNRSRPDLVPHEMHTLTMSFPSGHAMLSALIYLSAGVLVASSQPMVKLKVFIVALAVFASILVGLSRIYLGVHWPTDVVAGWIAGSTWALLWWLLALYYLPRRETDRLYTNERVAHV